MDATRADVRDHRCHARSELILDIQVPLAHVVAMGVGVGVGERTLLAGKVLGSPLKKLIGLAALF